LEEARWSPTKKSKTESNNRKRMKENKIIKSRGGDCPTRWTPREKGREYRQV